MNTSASVSPAWRWRILALLFFATTINYLDRIVFSVLIPVIREEMHITDQDYGWLTGAFTGAYTIGFLAAGKFIDRFGTRIGYAVSIVWWSIAAILHAVARTPLQLGIWRAFYSIYGNYFRNYFSAFFNKNYIAFV